jgi:hypothetical protein
MTKTQGILQRMREEELARLEELSPHALLAEEGEPEPSDDIKRFLRPYILRVKRKGLGQILNQDAKEAGEESPIKGFRLARG